MKPARRRLELMLGWDVNNGIARRAWARNEGAEFAIRAAMQRDPRLRVWTDDYSNIVGALLRHLRQQ